MKRLLLALLVVLFSFLYFQDSPAQVVTEDTKEKIRPLKRKLMGIEFYLQDRKDHEEFCPEIEWKQPKLKVYKKDPRSYLPEGCKES